MKTVSKIKSDRRSGIYMLYNVDAKKVYIGETINFHNRALQHDALLRAGTHPNKAMQKDYNKGDEFIFVILEPIEQKFENKDRLRDFLRLREMQYIKAFRGKWLETYNCDTSKKIDGLLYYAMISPSIEGIQKKMHKFFNCPLASIKARKPQTFKDNVPIMKSISQQKEQR